MSSDQEALQEGRRQNEDEIERKGASSRIPRARERQTKSMYDKKSVKLNKARPAPDFSKLHSKWQDKLQDGLAKTKKPSTVASGFSLNNRTKYEPGEPLHIEKKKNTHEAITPGLRRRTKRLDKSKVEDGLPRSRSKSKTRPQTNENMKFEADPSSLAQILGHKSVSPEAAHLKSRFSIYEKIDQRKRAESEGGDHTVRYSLYQDRTRTPLKDLNNIIEVLTPPQQERKSIYAKHSAKHSVKKSAMKTSEKLHLYNSGGRESSRKVTWSEKLSQSQRISQHHSIYSPILQTEDVKQSLVFTETEDELNQSLLQKIQKAEQVLNAQLSHKPAPAVASLNLNSTYVTRPNRNISVAETPVPESDTVIELLNGSRASSERPKSQFRRPDTPPPRPQFPSSDVLPVLTGVTRLAATPQEDTIAGLLDHLHLGSVGHYPVIGQTKDKSTINDGSPILTRIRRSRGSTQPANKSGMTPQGSLLDHSATLSSSADVTLNAAVTLQSKLGTSEQNITSDPVMKTNNSTENNNVPTQQTEVKRTEILDLDNILDISENAAVPTPLIKPLMTMKTSPELTESLGVIDRHIHKSRRRSAALHRRSLDNNELQIQLQLIMAQEQELEQQKLDIQKRLAVVRQSPLPVTKSEPTEDLLQFSMTSEISSVTNELKHSMKETQGKSSAITLTQSPSGLSFHQAENDTMIAGQLQDNTNITAQLDIELYEADDEISFMLPKSFNAGGGQGLRAISTGNKRRSLKRESINLMAFSPTLDQIREQSDTTPTGVDNITHESSSNVRVKDNTTISTVGISSEASNTIALSDLISGPEVESEKQASPLADHSEGDMECTDYALCADKYYTIDKTAVSIIPAQTALSKPLGASLQVSQGMSLASVSPRSLQQQSSFIANIDRVNNGHPTGHYDSLILGLGDKTQEHMLGDVYTPAVKRMGGTIGIYSPGSRPSTPVFRVVAKQTAGLILVNEGTDGTNSNKESPLLPTASMCVVSEKERPSGQDISSLMQTSEYPGEKETSGIDNALSAFIKSNSTKPAVTESPIVSPLASFRPPLNELTLDSHHSLLASPTVNGRTPLLTNQATPSSLSMQGTPANTSQLVSLLTPVATAGTEYCTPEPCTNRALTPSGSSSDMVATPDFLTAIKNKQASKKKTVAGTPLSSRALTNLGLKYREGLLDGEVSIYTCRAATNPTVSGDWLREATDPVSVSLTEGDSKHFIPIVDDTQQRQRLSIDGSAFYCYTP